eukprot:m.102222 g.102222  ORF g.102222 m.102222 type:complete len:947 (+) comp15499_c0_seq3:291-3131(+)
MSTVANKKLVRVLSDYFSDPKAKTFKGKYLGSAPISIPATSSVPLPQDLDAALAGTKGRSAPRKVWFVVAAHGVGMVSSKECELVSIAPLAELVCALQPAKPKHVVCFVTKHPRFGFSFGHFVELSSGSDDRQAVKDLHEAIQRGQQQAGQVNYAVHTQLGAQQSAPGAMAFALVFEAYFPVDTDDAAVMADPIRHVWHAVSKDKKCDPGFPAALLVNQESVRVFEALMQVSVHATELSWVEGEDHMDISTQKQPNRSVVCFLERDPRRNATHCLLFTCPTPDALHVCKALSNAKLQRAIHNPLATVTGSATHKSPVSHGDLDKLEVDRSLYRVVSELGSGQFGTVYLVAHAVEDAETGEPKQFAAKVLRDEAGHDDHSEFLREVTVMSQLSHRHVVKIVGICIQGMPWMAVLEFCPYGDLKAVLRALAAKRVALRQPEQLDACRQIASGMRHIAEHGFVHMDLACRNIMVAESSVLKIGDFGLTQEISTETGVYTLRDRLKLSIRWMAPETLTGGSKLFSEKTDVYAFGVTTWEIFSYGRKPFPGDTRAALAEIKEGKTLDMPPGCPPAVWTLMQKSWDKTPENRPSFAELERSYSDMMYQYQGVPLRDVGALINKNLRALDRKASRKAMSRPAPGTRPAAAPPSLASLAADNEPTGDQESETHQDSVSSSPPTRKLATPSVETEQMRVTSPAPVSESESAVSSPRAGSKQGSKFTVTKASTHKAKAKPKAAATSKVRKAISGSRSERSSAPGSASSSRSASRRPSLESIGRKASIGSASTSSSRGSNGSGSGKTRKSSTSATKKTISRSASTGSLKKRKSNSKFSRTSSTDSASSVKHSKHVDQPVDDGDDGDDNDDTAFGFGDVFVSSTPNNSAASVANSTSTPRAHHPPTSATLDRTTDPETSTPLSLPKLGPIKTATDLRKQCELLLEVLDAHIASLDEGA